MSSTALTSNPFQTFDLERNADWQGLQFSAADDGHFEEQTRKLDAAFHDAVASGGLLRFVRIYTEVSIEMLKRRRNQPLMQKLLGDALFRLVCYYRFLCVRNRPYLAEADSAYSWQLDAPLIAKAQEQAAQMERDNTMVRDYDLDADPALKEWVIKKVKPLLRSYVGSYIGLPWAHIRYADADRHSDGWAHIYSGHPFAYFHLDEHYYSLPLIVYLNDVDETNGPFSYVQGSDKLEQNFILRAFHQALYHGCKVMCHDPADRKMIAELPRVFRGGDLIGAYTGVGPFEKYPVVRFTGSAGRAIISDGFQLVHAGGHPREGSRKALFVYFRYPRKRVSDLMARVAKEYWNWRVKAALARSNGATH